MEPVRIGVIMNGVTGRMGTNQHLKRSILPIIRQGGLNLGETEILMPDPLLVGRNPDKLQRLAEESGVKKWSTDLEKALADPEYPVYFDAQTTQLRYDSVKAAIEAGKHIYCEKPSAESATQAQELCALAEQAGVMNGVVQDKLWLPGLRKLRLLKESGYFGEVLAIRGEFGYWVFTGEHRHPQRPSWNYRKEDGGGILLDMLPHWHYLLEDLFGRVKSVSCVASTLIKKRWDESQSPYRCTAEDTAYATFELEDGVFAHFNSSWVVRVRRDDLLTIQVDGTKGSAVAGLRECLVQPDTTTPRPVWNPDIENPINFFEGWTRVPDDQHWENAFRRQWELFLLHLAGQGPFPWNLASGARGVELTEAAARSWRQRSWIPLS